MKAEQLLRVKNALIQAQKLTDPNREAKNIVNFFFTVKKNIKLIEAATADFESLIEAQKQLMETDAAKAYEAKRIETVEFFAEKTEEGKPKVEDNMYVVTPENMQLFNAALAILNEEHADYQANMKDSNAAIDVYLQQEIECELRKLKLREIPSDLTGELMEVLYDIIEEPEA